jgi:hypothetical protein
LPRYFRALPDVFVQAELLEHEEVVYLGVMPPYFRAGTDGRQFQARELLALVAEVESFDVYAAIISLAKGILERSSLHGPATGAYTPDLLNGEVGARGFLLKGYFIGTLAVYIGRAAEAAITARGYQLQLLFVFHFQILVLLFASMVSDIE